MPILERMAAEADAKKFPDGDRARYRSTIRAWLCPVSFVQRWSPGALEVSERRGDRAMESHRWRIDRPCSGVAGWTAICFSVRKSGRGGLHVMTSDGTNVRRMDPGETLDVHSPGSWSPDGKWIAVTAYEGDKRRLIQGARRWRRPDASDLRFADRPVMGSGWTLILYRERQGPFSVSKRSRRMASRLRCPN